MGGETLIVEKKKKKTITCAACYKWLMARIQRDYLQISEEKIQHTYPFC